MNKNKWSDKIVFILIFMCSLLYTQCTDFNQLQCSQNNNCDWFEDVEYGNCWELSVNECYNYPNQCYVDSQPGWYDSSGPYCTGGNYQIDNSFCQEVEMPECNEEYDFQCTDGSCIPIHRVCNNFNDCEDGSDEINCEDCSELEGLECSNDDGCEWTEDIDSYNCNNISDNQCIDYEGCWLEEQCVQWGSWYSWICYDYDYQCSGGIFETDNSYCQEIEMPDCSEMNENQCDLNDSCDWIEDITQASCYYTFSSYAECIANGCSWYNPGSYSYMGAHCYGYYQNDNSYCEESADNILLGDYNLDGIINVLDVIQVIELILNGNIFSESVDMNYDSTINVLDVIVIIDIIIGR